MATGKFIAYLRVSTDKQGRSGLGLEAQRSAITSYLNGGAWELVKEYREIESGKKSDRPELHKAINHCKRTGATLLIAKLDRLSRDPDFLGMLMTNGFDFVACDMPEANKFMVRIMAALAEKEREMISERTKAALKAAKARGVKLGTPNLTDTDRQAGREKSLASRRQHAEQFRAELKPMLEQYRAEGLSLRQIADKLNKDGTLTSHGKTGTWQANQVRLLLK